ncbi:M48 family metalloprotease [Sphingomonas sp.]|uniref:M48 family metalloprotease n=1 Tax=Sphingomonas sp. TaxID=28214 RepID=UPI0035BBB188
MFGPFKSLFAIAMTAAPVPVFQATPEDAADLRLAAIGYRLATANVALCTARAPVPGLAIHALSEYDPPVRPAARAKYGFAMPVAVEGVVAASPAAAAGVQANDALVAVDGAPFPTSVTAGPATGADRDAALQLIASRPADAPLTLTVLRGGVRRAVTVPASPGCRTRFMVVIARTMEASADGTTVAIGTRFFERYTDDQVAVVVAHELAHNILRHRARLDAAGVKGGMLSELGRNGRLYRRTESEADLLGMYLLRNAGYDPQAAVRFWREHGGDVDGGLFRSRTHPSSSARAKAIEAAIETLPTDAPTPYLPPILSTRDSPLE